MRSTKQILYAVLLMGIVWISLFDHRLPTPIQTALFLAVLILGFVMIVAGWWCWARTRNAESGPRRQRRLGLFAVLANTAALVSPVWAMLYMMFYPFLRARVRLPMVDGRFLVLIVLVLSLAGLISGIFGPARTRFATVIGALVIGSVILSVPLGASKL